MHYIKLSHKNIYEGIISEFSTEIDDEHSINNILKEEGFWSTKKNTSITKDFFIIDYKQEVPINFIEILPSPSGNMTFPIDFRIETSINGLYWQNIQIEKSLNLLAVSTYLLNIPLTYIRYIKMFIIKPGKIGTKFFYF